MATVFLKYIAISFLLWLLFQLLIKRYTPYLWQRAYLLAIPIVAAAGALISVEMIALDRDDIIGGAISNITAVSDVVYTSIDGGGNTGIYTENKEGTTIETSLFARINFIWMAWGLIVAILLIRYLIGWRGIHKLQQLSTIERREDVSIYRCGLVVTPFSYFRSIFIDRKMNGERLSVVLSHEMAHINRYHYIDKALIEGAVIVS